MKINLMLLPVLLAFALAGCAGVTVKTDFDPEVDFLRLKTFTWDDHQTAPDDALVQNPLVGKRVRVAVESELRKKGFRLETSGDADFVVATHAGVKERMQVTNWGRYGWYDPWWGPYGGNVEVSYYQYGTLVIDIIDPSQKELIWRGLGKGIVQDQETGERSQRAVTETVAQILKDFPPQPRPE